MAPTSLRIHVWKSHGDTCRAMRDNGAWIPMNNEFYDENNNSMSWWWKRIEILALRLHQIIVCAAHQYISLKMSSTLLDLIYIRECVAALCCHLFFSSYFRWKLIWNVITVKKIYHQQLCEGLEMVKKIIFLCTFNQINYNHTFILCVFNNYNASLPAALISFSMSLIPSCLKKKRRRKEEEG